MTVDGTFAVRAVVPEDDAGLSRLMERCTEDGAITTGFRMKGSIFAMPSRHGMRRMYVAANAAGDAVGMGFADHVEVQLDGARVPAAYFSTLRTDPDWRRRGVASGILERRIAEAERDHGAVLCWAGILGGNKASHRTLAKAGFRRARGCGLKVIVPSRQAPCPPELAARVRPARTDDVAWIVDGLTRMYGHLNLWSPWTAETYVAGLGRLAGTRAGATGGALPANASVGVWVLTGADDRPLASLLSYGMNDIVEPIIVRVSPFMRLVNALLQLPIRVGAPLRTTVLGDVVTAPGAAASGIALARHVMRAQAGACDLVVMGDYERSGTRAVLKGLKGLPTRLDVVVRSARPWAKKAPVFLEVV